MQIKKRNGELAEFDKQKIIRAINKAVLDVEGGVSISYEDIEHIASAIENKAKENSEIFTVEKIQDEVIKSLMDYDKDLAMKYQTYRVEREEKRNFEKSYEEKIGQLLGKDKQILNENANKDAKTISVQRDLLAGISSKNYYLKNILPKEIAEAHEKGEIHVHDLDYLLFKETNCENVDLARMLKGGCKIGNANMMEPNSVDVAVGHTVQIIASVSSNTYGGCTIPYIDATLVPYIRKTFMKHFFNGYKFLYNEEIDRKEFLYETGIDFFGTDEKWEQVYDFLLKQYNKVYNYAVELTEESVKQAIQGLEYEINSLSTVNGQTPFTTVGFGTETSWEGRLVQKYILKTRAAGFGANKDVAIFPKLVYAVADGINFKPEDPNWDISQIAFECMTKSIYPDILFVTKNECINRTVVYPIK